MPRILLSQYFGDTSEDEITQVYLALLRDPEPSRDTLVTRGIEPDVIDHAIEVLHSRGFVDASDPEQWVVASPDIAIRAYASAIERQARRARATADDMALIYRQTRQSGSTGPDEQVRTLSSIADIEGAATQVMARARRQVVAMRAVPSDLDQLVPLLKHRQAELAQSHHAGVETRGVYDGRLLDMPDALRILQDLSSDGADIRLAPNLPFSAIVADGELAVLDFRNIEASGRGSYLVESGPIVTAVLSLIERIHTDAVPLPAPGRAGTEHPGLTARDQVVLALLAAGASDSTIARQLEISRRTVERRVQHIMAYMGVTTRFQTGVEAVRRGLV